MITVLISAGALGCGKKADAQAGKDTAVVQENAATAGVRENTTTKTAQGGENKENGAKEDETPQEPEEQPTEQPQEPVINTSHTNVYVVSGYGTEEYNRDANDGGVCPYTLYQATS